MDLKKKVQHKFPPSGPIRTARLDHVIEDELIRILNAGKSDTVNELVWKCRALLKQELTIPWVARQPRNHADWRPTPQALIDVTFSDGTLIKLKTHTQKT